MVNAILQGQNPSASEVQFADGQTFQQKLDSGALKGPKGDQGTVGPAGKDGSPGATGPAGPNQVSTTTSTNITGILKGNGSVVESAVANTDYLPVDNPIFTGAIKSKATGSGSAQTYISGSSSRIQVGARSGGMSTKPNYISGFSVEYTGHGDIIRVKQGDITGTSFTDVNIRGIASPSENTDAANKQYVDNKINRTDTVSASNTSYSTYMARGIAAGTSAPSSLTSGCIYLVYE